ncbi:Protein FAR-RED IMPAIRED RESPONSE 1 [Bienertia sinuspersici]
MDLPFNNNHPGIVSSVVDQREDIGLGEGANRDMVDLVDVVHDEHGRNVTSATSDLLLEGDIDIGPDSDLQFESHEAAYKFYQEYAKSMGFTTSIKNSRRSKKSKDFIDAKFACSRYGITPESDLGSSRRSGVKKTNCKASMHVKKNKYGKWVIHEFIRDHNHELLPALAYYFRIHKNVKSVEKNNFDILHAVEVLGVVGCHPKKEAWDETKSQVSCLCRSFEYRGFLCRHAMLVLQICGISSIPSQYILRRWTKDAKTRQFMVEGTERLQTRAHRYVALSKKAIELSEEGSLAQESHNIALRALMDTLKTCVNVNNMNRNSVEVGDAYSAYDIVEAYQGNMSARTNKKKNAVKKRKVASEPDVVLTDAEDSLHQMENLTSEVMSLNGYYGSQQNEPGLVPLNLMEPPHDSYYVDQESMQGLGQLNSIGSNHEGFFGAQHSVHGLLKVPYFLGTLGFSILIGLFLQLAGRT